MLDSKENVTDIDTKIIHDKYCIGIIELKELNIEYFSKIQNLLFMKDDIWIDYYKYDLFETSYKIVVKKIKQDVVNVTDHEYVYHYSPKKNRNDILKNGLKKKSFKESRWKNSIELSYPDSVFLSTSKDGFYSSYENYDLYRINKSKYIFYKDINEHYMEDSIMCFEDIKKEDIEIL